MPSLSNMFADFVAQQNGAFEPQRADNFLVQLTIPQSVGLGPDSEKTLSLSTNAFPGLESMNNVSVIDFLNEQRKFAGKATFQDLTITFKDYVDTFTAQILQMWRQQVYDPFTGRVGLARNYKSTGVVSLTAPDGISFVREYQLVGIWPAMFNSGDLDMTSDEPVMISCTFVLDKYYPVTQVAASGGSNQGAYSGPPGTGGIIG